MPHGSERGLVGPSEPEKKGQRQSSILSCKTGRIYANSSATHKLNLTESTHLSEEQQASKFDSQSEHPRDYYRLFISSRQQAYWR